MKGPLPAIARLRAWTLLVFAAVVLAAGVAAVALGFFASPGFGTASAGVGSVSAPAAVTAEQAGADITISWGAATRSDAGAVQGYRVTRSDGAAVCGSPTPVSGLSCSDPAVGVSHTYTVTAVLNTFTKAATSAAVTVLSAPAISAAPSDPSANTTPSFSFSGGAGTAFACQLDSGTIAACTSPKSYAGTAAGAHTFRVRATRGAGSGPFASSTWTLAGGAPTITGTPSDPSTSAAPVFNFVHSTPGFGFRCKLDAAAFADCFSPKPYAGVASGSHTFQVQALGADGFTTTAASFTWVVDATAPVASLPPAGGLIWGNATTNTIGRANLDGTGVNLSLVSGATRPIAVAADSSFIYWINDRNTNQTLNSIGRANLDGSSPNQNFLVVPYAYSVAVDSSYLYWTSIGHNTVGRANLNGTGFNNSFISGANGPTAMAISSSHVVWPNINVKTIGRANIDASSVNQTALGPLTTGPGAVAVNGSYIYWTSGTSIARANIDGSAPNTAFITGTSGVGSVAVDESRIYWTAGGAIGRANLDGSAPTPSFVTGLGSPSGVAVVPSAAGSSYLSGSTIYYNAGVSGSLTLTAAVTDSGSGPASATFPAIATAGWIHDPETVTTGSGTAPTIKYTSSAFNWSASPGNPSGYVVTGKDTAGNASSAVALTFSGDSAAPAGGALSVNATAAAGGGGSTSTSAAANFAITSRTDYAEALSASQSGLRTSTLNVRSATLTAGTCGAPGSAGPFATAVAITGTTQPAGFVSGRCYVYTLAGVDKVANSAQVSTTVQVP